MKVIINKNDNNIIYGLLFVEAIKNRSCKSYLNKLNKLMHKIDKKHINLMREGI